MTSDGRRIYIHEYSLGCLRPVSQILSEDVTRAIWATKLLKTFHHHVYEQGVLLGLVRSDSGRAVASEAQDQWGSSMSTLLRSLVRRRVDASDQVCRLLEEDEDVVATCGESGYLTFATGEIAASRMFDDHEPLHQLLVATNAGLGPKDLTMIRGRNLAPFEQALGIGGVSRHYFPLRVTLTPEQVEVVARETRHLLFQESIRMLDGLRGQTSDEALICGNLELVVRHLLGIEDSHQLQECSSQCG